MNKGENVNMNFLELLNEMGIGWRYLLNGFIGAIVWSIYKKLKLIEALRQILIGSIVAGYITPLIAHKEAIPIEYMAALSFIIGMIGMIIIDGIYKYIAGKVKLLRKGKEKITEELENSEN
jgi:uncharacterized membrane protein YeaQ/YmgE (transglycosylase-associated protein family)